MAGGSRQTVSFLTKRFREIGLEPDKRHGQNFLIDLNLVDLLIRTADLQPDDVVLEVGTGTGSLTALIASRAAAVVTVEIDNHLHQLAREELVDFDNVTFLKQDVLRNKNHFHDNVIEAVKVQMAVDPSRRFKLVANLPYNIATPVLSNLLLTEIVPDSMTATIQKELAERMVAVPSTKDYSALSIWMQSLCDVELVRVMPPGVFWPRPKVDSAIVKVVHRPERRSEIPDVEFFHDFVRALFFHRRKFLRSVVLSAFKGKLDKPHVDQVLGELKLGSDARAEQLDIETIKKLSEAFRQKLAGVEQGRTNSG